MPMESELKPQRRGRAARQAKRTEGNDDQPNPVWPGVVGGRFLPLRQCDMEKINETVMDLLANVGLSQAIPSMVEHVMNQGGTLTDEQRLLFPRGLVEDVIADCRKEFVLYGQKSEHDIEVSGHKVFVGTGGASPNIIDIETGLYREPLLKDLYDVARVVDTMDNIHFFNRSLVPRDCPDPETFDINTAYACLQGTSKHLGISITAPEHVAKIIEMFDIVAGGKGKFREKPFCTLLSCHVVPPLRFAEEACEVLEYGVNAGFPVQLISAGQAGATSPVTLAGAVVQAVAESLAGLVFVYLVDNNVCPIFAPKPLVSDLRTGSMCGGSGEQGVLMAAAAQMGSYYGLITSSMAGMTDAKVPDAQHGFEKCHGLTLAAHAGANVITQGCGLQASLLGCAFESYIIDNDMIGSVLRGVRGVEVNHETLARNVIDHVVNHEGHYLGEPQTLERMETDYYYPKVADRESPADWQDKGGLDIRERARLMAKDILHSHYPDHIAPELDQTIREKFNICLAVNHIKRKRA